MIIQKYMRAVILFGVMLHLNLHAQTSRLTAFSYDAFGGPSVPVQSSSYIFFSAYDSIHGRELWRTDGTSSGTQMVKDIFPGTSGGIGNYFELTAFVLNDILYFRGDDGINGIELWRSDGTDAGTYMVKNLDGGPGDGAPGEFASVNNTLYFTAQTGTQLWKSDGTANGTVSIAGFNVITNLTGFNGALYFSADNSNSGQELWKSNGTANGTNLLKDLNGTFGASLPCNFHATSSLLYFMAVTNDGWELWKTDGTNGGTVMVKDINPGGANGVLSSYSDAYMNHVGDTLFFKANDGISGYQLWMTDGSVAGTVKLSNLPDFVDSYCKFSIAGNKVLVNNYALAHFWAYDVVTGVFDETNYPTFQYFNSLEQKYVFDGTDMYYCGKDSVFGCEVRYCNEAPGSDRILHETYLIDNWSDTQGQYYNKIYGIVNNKLVFSAGRQPYNTLMPLFAYDINGAPDCMSPVMVVPVPLADTAAHLIWSEIPEALSYTVFFRESGITQWDSVTTTQTYFAWNQLNAITDYEFRVQVNCYNGTSLLSEVIVHNTGFIGSDYNVTMLGDKPESETVHRLYWLRSSPIAAIQIRYKPYGSPTWNTVNNSSGYRRLTNLIPATLYEYQVRPDYGGVFGQWSVSSLYFYTRNTLLTDIPLLETTTRSLRVFPNPATNKVWLIGDQINPEADVAITDLQGNLITISTLDNNHFSVSDLASGMYLVIVKDKDLVSRYKLMVLHE